jgi:hypothetical protein
MMKPGDLRRFKIDTTLKSVNLDGKPFVVVKHRVCQDGTNLVGFLLDGKVWELAQTWVLLNSEALDETR